MSDKPIIFSGPMVRAILDGRKTMTRRVLKPQPEPFDAMFSDAGRWWTGDADTGEVHQVLRAPYAPGDVLWVRENCWAEDRGERCGVCYAADKAWIEFNDAEHHEDYFKLRDYAWKANEGFESNSGKLVPSIFMPRWASRITLRVVGVKVERLQYISEADAVAEGCLHHHDPSGDGQNVIEQFSHIWQSIHGPGSWDANPWVAAITFEKEPRP